MNIHTCMCVCACARMYVCVKTVYRIDTVHYFMLMCLCERSLTAREKNNIFP